MNDTIRSTCRNAIAAGHSRYPLVREMVLDRDTPVTAFHKLHRGNYGFLLESLEGGERWARYTFLATEPSQVFRYHGNRVTKLVGNDSWEEEASELAPLAHLSALMRSTTAPELPRLPRFTGGAVGFWGYDVIRSIEDLPSPHPVEDDLPDAVAMTVDTLLVLDNLFNRAIVIANISIEDGLSDAELDDRIATAESCAEEWLQRLSAPSQLAPLGTPEGKGSIDYSTPYPDAKFCEDVARCQEFIAAGDAFQIVLSRKLCVVGQADPFGTYRWLRALNPAPYCYFLELGNLTLAGASPEVLVRVEHGAVTVRPIAGTRPRGNTQVEDIQFEADLLADPKERAEHLMLLDLGRNDVGRVASYGSVEVVEQMVVERYSQVMHLVSEVRGALRDNMDSLDALAAAFPAGTVSGAPKVRAMQIIDELEPSRRGPYAGAVGYVGYGATVLDTAIAIRTVVFENGTATVQAGAGIVADSVPSSELAETLAKAGAVLKALGFAQIDS